jgi:hypothetical protein
VHKAADLTCNVFEDDAGAFWVEESTPLGRSFVRVGLAPFVGWQAGKACWVAAGAFARMEARIVRVLLEHGESVVEATLWTGGWIHVLEGASPEDRVHVVWVGEDGPVESSVQPPLRDWGDSRPTFYGPELPPVGSRSPRWPAA